MATDKRVQILLSTYNGERYLRQQLESFFAMERYDECCILIRDDGSTDGTVEILREYKARSEIRVEYGENLGVISSYQWLIENSDHDCTYFAFSDQDDVWLPEKLSVALSLLDAHSQEKPLLFASCTCVTDETLREIGRSEQPRRGISYYNAMVQNVLPGHTQIFNRALRDSLRMQDMSGVHAIDWWSYLVASAMGEVIYYPKYTVLHRQHSDNAVGYQLRPLESLRKKLKYIRQGKGNAISIQLQAFLTNYREELPEKYRLETERYLAGTRTLRERFSYLCHSRVFRQRTVEDFGFRILYLLGKYKID